MPIVSRPTAAAAALSFLILVTPATASEPPASPSTSSSVRAETAGMKQLIADGTAGSAAFRTLVSAVEQSDLVVYVRCRLFPEQELRGRLGLLPATRGPRYAVIELSCYQPHGALLATLAHELQHAVEVASAPWVVDTRTLEAFYAAMGELSRNDAWARTYETPAAVEQARRVHLELLEADRLRASARAAASRVQRELRHTDTGGFK